MNPEYGMSYGKIIEFNDKGYQKKKVGYCLLSCKFFIPVMIKKEIFDDIGIYDETLFMICG